MTARYQTILVTMLSAWVATVACFVAPAVSAETTLRVVTFSQPDRSYPSMVMIRRFIERVNKAGKGVLKLDYIGGPSVVPLRDQMNATSKGVVDMVMTFTIHQALVPEIGTVGMSEISPKEEREVGYIDLLDEAHKKIGIKVMGRTATDVGFHIFSKKPINRMADLKNVKIRSHSGYDSFMKAIGASPIHMKISEIYPGLERGVVQAAPFPLAATSIGIHEVICCAMANAFWPAHTTFSYINRGKWNKLSAAAKKLMLDEQAEMERFMVPKGRELKSAEMAKLQKSGVKFISLPADEAKKWVDIANGSRWTVMKKRLAPEQYAKIRKMITR
jgi:TRAP-type C4-dicarboxylate transport system substrate-binding protein